MTIYDIDVLLYSYTAPQASVTLYRCLCLCFLHRKLEIIYIFNIYIEARVFSRLLRFPHGLLSKSPAPPPPCIKFPRVYISAPVPCSVA